MLLNSGPMYFYKPVLFVLLYASSLYSYMSVLHTCICQSYILFYAGPIYTYMLVLHTLIFQSCVHVYDGPT